MRLSNLVARVEDRVAAAYVAAKPAVAARAVSLRDAALVRIEAAKHARAFYKQVVAEVEAKR